MYIIYIYLSISISIYLSIYIYLYIYIYTCAYMFRTLASGSHVLKRVRSSGLRYKGGRTSVRKVRDAAFVENVQG